MKFTELIKAALKKAGLPEDLHESIKVEKEEDIDGLVDELKKKIVPPAKTFAEMLQDDKFKADLDEHTSKQMQPEIDRRVTQALKTYDEKIKGKKTGTEEEDEKIAALEAKIDKLTESITGQAKEQEQQRLKSLATAKLKESGLPESWANRIKVESETEIEGAIKVLSDEMTAIKQGVIDAAIKQSPIPGVTFSKSTSGVTTAKIDEFANELKSEDASVKVQELK